MDAIRASFTTTAGSHARRLFIPLALACALAAGAGRSLAAESEHSEPSKLAAKSLLLDIARVGDRLVAVGERGHIVLSSDEGVSWQQVVTPTRAMLTGVSFADAQNGWAVGHDGVVLHSADGGQSWARRDQRQDLETVFLDVLFINPQHGFIVGAYGKFLETADGGATWSERRVCEDELHFNRISSDGENHLFIAGESGLLLRSQDLGQTWQRLATPYEGSFYGVRPLSDGVLIAYGLRGHIFVSTDGGETWHERETDVKVLLMACTRLRDGVAVLAGQGGNFYISRDAGRTFHHWKPDDFGTSVADLAVTKDGALVTVGEAGAVRLKIP